MEQEKDTPETPPDNQEIRFSPSKIKSILFYKRKKWIDPIKTKCKRSRRAHFLDSQCNSSDQPKNRKVGKKKVNSKNLDSLGILDAVRARLPEIATRNDSFLSMNNQSGDLSSLLEFFKSNTTKLIGNNSEEELRISYEICMIILEKSSHDNY